MPRKKKTIGQWFLMALLFLVIFPPALLMFLAYVVALLFQKFILRRPTEQFALMLADKMKRKLKPFALIFWLILGLSLIPIFVFSQKVAIFNPEPTMVINTDFPQLGYWEVPSPDSLKDASPFPIWLVSNHGPQLEIKFSSGDSVTVQHEEFVYLVWDCDRWRFAEFTYISDQLFLGLVKVLVYNRSSKN